MKKIIFILASTTIMFLSCSPVSNTKEQITSKIAQKEKELNNIVLKRSLSTMEIDTLINLYEQYYKTYPKDTTTASYLMKAGRYSMSINNKNRAIRFYHIVETKYQNTSFYPMSIFLQGFVYDQSNDTTGAKNYYNKFIKKFPNHSLVKDAKISLKNLGKSLDEIIKSFKKTK